MAQYGSKPDILFCRFGATDDKMLEWLKDKGFTITYIGLIWIRLQLNLKRQENSQKARGHTDEIIWGLIEQELGKNVIQGYRREQLVEHFRQMRHLVIRYSFYNFKLLNIHLPVSSRVLLNATVGHVPHTCAII